jgi:hypothetical protein
MLPLAIQNPGTVRVTDVRRARDHGQQGADLLTV